jgi:hypothetical protein
MEYNIWYDEPGETFKHIGQWGSLVAAVLVFVAAIVDRFSEKFTRLLVLASSKYLRIIRWQ